MPRDTAQCHILSALNQDLGHDQWSTDTDGMAEPGPAFVWDALSPQRGTGGKIFLSTNVFLALF